MTTQPSEFQPRDRHGRFATSVAPEAPHIYLVPDTVAQPSDRFDRAWAVAEEMVAFRTSDGFTEALRDDDAEELLREIAPHLDAAEFDRRFAVISSRAEQASILEHSADEAADFAAWSDIASDLGLDPEDFPREDRWPGEDYTDWDAFHSAARDEALSRLRAAVEALAVD